MNHSGQENALFQSSAGSASSPFRSWYVWQDVKPEGWTNWSGADTWSANTLGPGYYYSVFWSGMPDFNLQHPAAFAYHLDNLRFWLNRGVDGFRFDAVEVLTETGSTRWSNQFASYSLLKQARELIESYPHRYMVCEAPGDPDRAAGNNACRGAFAFNLSSTLKEAARGSGMASTVSAFPTQHPIGGLATLLSNHDAFAGERPYTFFNGDEAQARLAAATLLTLPGVPFLYYGEEVGMSNNSTYGGSDWRLRVPMSWTADTATAGFTTGVPFRRPADNVATHNVALEQSDPDSMFSYYKRLLNLRRTSRSLRMGLYQPLTVDEPTGNVLAFLRRYGSEASLVVINYGSAVSSFSLTLGSPFNGATFHNLFPEVTGTLTADNQGTLALDIPSQSVRIFRAAVGDNLPYPGATLYIRGEMTDWNATNAMIYVGGGLYQGSFHLTARDTPYLFKIADANWAPYNFGAIGSQAVTPGVPVQLEQTAWNNGGVGHDLLLLVSQDGDYTLTLDGSNPVNPRLTVTQ